MSELFQGNSEVTVDQEQAQLTESQRNSVQWGYLRADHGVQHMVRPPPYYQWFHSNENMACDTLAVRGSEQTVACSAQDGLNMGSKSRFSDYWLVTLKLGHSLHLAPPPEKIPLGSSLPS